MKSARIKRFYFFVFFLCVSYISTGQTINLDTIKTRFPSKIEYFTKYFGKHVDSATYRVRLSGYYDMLGKLTYFDFKDKIYFNAFRGNTNDSYLIELGYERKTDEVVFGSFNGFKESYYKKLTDSLRSAGYTMTTWKSESAKETDRAIEIWKLDNNPTYEMKPAKNGAFYKIEVMTNEAWKYITRDR